MTPTPTLTETSQATNADLYRHMLDAVGQAVIATDTEGTVIYWNRAAEKLYRCPASEALDHNILEITPAEGAESRAAEIFATLRDGKTWSGEFPVRRRDGSEFPALVTDTPVFDESGEMVAIVGVSADLTDVHRSRDSLQRRHRWLTAILENSGDLFSIVSAEGTVLYANHRAAATFQRPPFEMVGTSVFELLDPAELERGRSLWERTLATPGLNPAEDFCFTDHTGNRRCVEVVSNNMLEDPLVHGIVITARDVTGRMVATEQLERTNDLLATIMATHEAMIHATDAEQAAGEICRVIVEHGGFALAAIVAPGADAGQVRPITVHGAEDGYFAASAAPDPDRPLWMALETGDIQVVGDIVTDVDETAWQTAALARGYHSMIAIPIMVDDGAVRVLGIAADRPHAFDGRAASLLAQLGEDLAFALTNLRIREERDAYWAQLESSFDSLIGTMANMLEDRDPYTAGHQRRVATISVAIAEELGLDPDTVKGIEVAATIHDIGKIGIPAEILTHPGKLSPAQFELIRQHSQTGHDIVANVDFPWPVAEMILQHHERIDGSGYPHGLRGHETLLGARIIAVADTVEAMSSHRPYRPALGEAKALAHIRSEQDALFDADVVDACLALFRKGCVE